MVCFFIGCHLSCCVVVVFAVSVCVHAGTTVFSTVADENCIQNLTAGGVKSGVKGIILLALALVVRSRCAGLKPGVHDLVVGTSVFNNIQCNTSSPVLEASLCILFKMSPN